MDTPYEILDRKRRGERFAAADIAAMVDGAVDGGWSDAQLGAFLMAAALGGLDGDETRALTREMLDSGDRWSLAREVPLLGDKHSTGGVGDKVSLILAPVMAACGLPIAMLTGRGLGHTGGTADKLEGIPGLDLSLSRADMVRLLDRVGIAIGVATASIAPADRRLYGLRDVTGTVVSVPLIAASILSKKLALGASGVVYDVKTGQGAFLADPAEARQLAELLVTTSAELGAAAAALVTDMSQPLGRWVGHHAEVLESMDCLAGEAPGDLRELVIELGVALAGLLDVDIEAERIDRAFESGEALETFMRWAEAQGADADWLANPGLPLAPVEVPLRAAATGWLQKVDTRSLGLLLAAAGGGRRQTGDSIDHGVALRYDRRVGERLSVGDELGRAFLRREDAGWVSSLEACFTIGAEKPVDTVLIVDRL